MLLLSIHPLLQSLAILLAFYAAYLGWPRTLSLHFARRTRFDRWRHALLGSLALGAMMGGTAGGLIVVSRFLHKPILTEVHGKTAMVALPFLVLGLASGIYLYRYPRPRKVLPSLHAINNLLLLLLTLLQGFTGLKLYLWYLSVG